MSRPALILLALLGCAAWPLASRAQGAGPEASLDSAYTREAQMLEAERDALARELARLRDRAASQRADRRAAIRARSEELAGLRREAEALEDELDQVRRGLDMSSSRQDLLESTLKQALATLARLGEPVEAEGVEPAELIPRLAAAGARLILRASTARVERGAFFALDGREVEGHVIHLGRVAALGSAPGAAGVLAPAGAGRLKLVDAEPAEQVAQILAERALPPLTPIFLIDPLADVTAGDGADDALSFLASGGPIVWPIVGLGFLALLLVLERLFVLRRVHVNTERLMTEVHQEIQQGHWDRATDRCGGRPGSASRVLQAALRSRHLERELFDDAVTEAIIAELPRLERFLSALHVIAAVAPLLGLLGTVTGMISTFDVITEHGTGDPKLLSGGISEALITTEVGLIVAIPVLLLHSLLASRVDHVVGDMERSALRISNTIHREHCARLKQGGCVGSQYEDAPCPHLLAAAAPGGGDPGRPGGG